ncbi:hypothetical protein ONZ45_g2664 [Pleurotus djamor]|nr:hypothetical protein ONZ45_g2664 [Pleurotus djamor]
MATTRRSQRSKLSAVPISNVPEFEPQELNDEEDTELSCKTKPVKRRKVASRTKATSNEKHVVHRGKGKLRNLPHMPLDVLFEVRIFHELAKRNGGLLQLKIFRFLSPLDLLRLARTTKDLRSLLMKRSSLTLWKAVFDHVPDIPEKPEDMAEPAWANFLFTNNCFVCLSPRASHVLSAHCLRYCKRCIEDKVYISHYGSFNATIQIQLSQFLHPPSVYTTTHAYRLSSGTGKLARIHFSLSQNSLFFSRLGQNRFAKAYLKTAFDKFVEDYKLVHDNEEERSKFMKTNTEHLTTLRTREERCKNWFAKKQSDRSGELENIRAARYEDITRKLTELGWGLELEKMDWSAEREMKQHPAVRPSKLLTDRTWPKIEGELVSLMEKFHTQRLKRERAQLVRERRRTFARVIKNYAATQPVNAIIPSAIDLYDLESFAPLKQLIEESSDDHQIVSSTFDEFLAEMPTLCKQWKEACASKLLQSFNLTAPRGMFMMDLLSLAKIAFRCTRCSATLGSPHLFTHPCLRKPASTFFAEYESRLEADLQAARWLEVAPQRLNLLHSSPASAIVKACGLDPDTATHEELNSTNPWLVGSTYGCLHVMRSTRALGKVPVKKANAERYPWDLGDDLDEYSWTRVTDEALIETCSTAELHFYKQRRFGSPVICAHCSEEVATDRLVPHMHTHRPGQDLERADFLLPRGCPISDLYCRTLEGLPPMELEPNLFAELDWGLDDF